MNPITIDQNLKIWFDFFVTSMIVVSLIFYGLAAFWNIKFLVITKTQTYSWTKIFIAICCILYVIVFSYVSFNNIFLKEVDISVFSALFIRPITLLMGAALATSARARITSLKSGGEEWILRKSLN
jgi:hypothetical protein